MVPDNLSGPQAVRLITRVHDIMNGKQWDADTMQAIADMLDANGFTFDDPQEDEESE